MKNLRFYYADSRNQPAGPVSYDDLCALAAAGQLRANSKVIHEGGTGWVKLKDVLGDDMGRVPAAAPQESVARKWWDIWALRFVGAMLILTSMALVTIHFFTTLRNTDAGGLGEGPAAVLVYRLDATVDKWGAAAGWAARSGTFILGAGVLLVSSAMTKARLREM